MFNHPFSNRIIKNIQDVNSWGIRFSMNSIMQIGWESNPSFLKGLHQNL